MPNATKLKLLGICQYLIFKFKADNVHFKRQSHNMIDDILYK